MSHPHRDRSPSVRVGFDDRLAAEAVRVLEADGSAPIHNAGAEAAAREAAVEFEPRIVHRARALPERPPLTEALRQVSHAAGVMVVTGLVAAAIIGATATRTALGPGGEAPANFFWVLLSLLGIQTVMLLGWAVVMLMRPRTLAGGSLAAGPCSDSISWDAAAVEITSAQTLSSSEVRMTARRWERKSGLPPVSKTGLEARSDWAAGTMTEPAPRLGVPLRVRRN